MTTNQIIAALTTGPAIEEIDVAFQKADKHINFAYKFKKTKSYWSESQWKQVAKSVKIFIKSQSPAQ